MDPQIDRRPYELGHVTRWPGRIRSRTVKLVTTGDTEDLVVWKSLPRPTEPAGLWPISSASTIASASIASGKNGANSKWMSDRIGSFMRHLWIMELISSTVSASGIEPEPGAYLA